MSTLQFAASFYIVKYGNGERDFEVDDYKLVVSHRYLEDTLLFHEDVLRSFVDGEEYKELKIDHGYRVFIWAEISPVYSDHWETGKELDGYDYDEVSVNIQDLGEYCDE